MHGDWTYILIYYAFLGMCTCRGGDDAMVRVLLEAGADWKFVSEPEGGKDARGIAAYYGKSSVVSIIDEWQNEDKHKGQAMS